MTGQLILIGLFLQYIFAWNNPWLNSAWLCVMVIVAVHSAIKSCALKPRHLFIPMFASFFLSVILVILFVNIVVLKVPDMFGAKYLIVISGMLLGNTLKGAIIGLNSFYQNIRKDQKLYQYVLAIGASRFEAMLPYVRESLQAALRPTLATMATMGIVFLPGMMTGTILGGASPVVAIKYQIMIMLAIFACTTLGIVFTIVVSIRTSFHEYGLLNERIFANSLQER
jgi:putative ABC transport system permease protein